MKKNINLDVYVDEIINSCIPLQEIIDNLDENDVEEIVNKFNFNKKVDLCRFLCDYFSKSYHTPKKEIIDLVIKDIM